MQDTTAHITKNKTDSRHLHYHVIKVILLMILFFTLCFTGQSIIAKDAKFLGGKLSDQVSRQMLYVQKLMEQKKYSQARERLLAVIREGRLHEYEAAVVYQTLGFVYASLENYTATTTAFEKALTYNILSRKVQQSLRLNLGQLYTSQADYKKATIILEQWQSQEKSEDIQVNELLAIGYFNLQQYKLALPHINKLLQKKPSKDKSWLRLLIASHMELSQMREATVALHKAIESFPLEKDFWRLLAQVYLQQEKIDSSLATMQLAYEMDLLEEGDIELLAKLYLHQEIPVEAAKLLQHNLANQQLKPSKKIYDLLARSWLMARELPEAVLTYGKMANISKDGTPLLQQAEIYLELRNWSAASKAVEKALDKGVNKQRSRAYLLLGIARYQQEQLAQARQALLKAKKAKSVKKAAEQWLQQVKFAEEELLKR